MTSGKPLTQREQIYILKWAGKRTWGQIVQEMANLYPEDNEGPRNVKTLSVWYSAWDADAIDISIRIRRSIKERASEAGLTPVEIAYMLEQAIQNYITLPPKPIPKQNNVSSI